MFKSTRITPQQNTFHVAGEYTGCSTLTRLTWPEVPFLCRGAITPPGSALQHDRDRKEQKEKQYHTHNILLNNRQADWGPSVIIFVFLIFFKLLSWQRSWKDEKMRMLTTLLMKSAPGRRAFLPPLRAVHTVLLHTPELGTGTWEVFLHHVSWLYDQDHGTCFVRCFKESFSCFKVSIFFSPNMLLNNEEKNAHLKPF